METKPTAPHTGQLLRAYTRKRKISHSAWQQVSGKAYSTIIKYQKQPSMRVDTLFEICLTLKHNFMREIADMLPAELEPRAIPDKTAEVTALQQRIAQLETQVATLEKALALVGGRGG
jgi:DNA anti-recombination protein RmuC